jgi:hypothetical protein
MAAGRLGRLPQAGGRGESERAEQTQHEADKEAEPRAGAFPAAGLAGPRQRRRELALRQSPAARGGRPQSPPPPAQSPVLAERLRGARAATATAPEVQLDAAPAPATTRPLQPAQRTHQDAGDAQEDVAGPRRPEQGAPGRTRERRLRDRSRQHAPEGHQPRLHVEHWLRRQAADDRPERATGDKSGIATLTTPPLLIGSRQQTTDPVPRSLHSVFIANPLSISMIASERNAKKKKKRFKEKRVLLIVLPIITGTIKHN